MRLPSHMLEMTIQSHRIVRLFRFGSVSYLDESGLTARFSALGVASAFYLHRLANAGANEPGLESGRFAELGAASGGGQATTRT